MPNYWFIAIKERGKDIYNLDGLTILKSPPGHFWADPFLADKYLFFEDYDYEKGIISVGELDGLTLKNVRPVLVEREHLSFPSLLYDDGSWYMTPERHNARVLRVYRATQFPDQWQPIVRVARGRFDDPLLRKTERGFEIWTTKADVLHVFEAKRIVGPWRLVRTHTAPFQRSAGNFIGDIRPTRGRPHDRADVVSESDRHAHVQRFRYPRGDRWAHRGGRLARSGPRQAAAAAPRAALASRLHGLVGHIAGRQYFVRRQGSAAARVAPGGFQASKAKVMLI